MAKRKPSSKSSSSATLVSRVPADVAAVVQGETIDLSDTSVFCKRQADSAVFWGIAQIKPGIFVLKSPFKESFIGSLHCYMFPNMGLCPAETIAYALVRHASWCLKTLDIDALRSKGGAHLLEPKALRAPLNWKEGILRPTGDFTFDPEADGTPAILAWQDNAGGTPGFAIEICGPGVASQAASFRRTLLQRMADAVSIELGVKRPRSGRPHLAAQAEAAAYWRDHRYARKATIAKKLCACGKSRHTQYCFDRLNKLADSFYRTQRSAFERLVLEQGRKYPEIAH